MLWKINCGKMWFNSLLQEALDHTFKKGDRQYEEVAESAARRGLGCFTPPQRGGLTNLIVGGCNFGQGGKYPLMGV